MKNQILLVIGIAFGLTGLSGSVFANPAVPPPALKNCSQRFPDHSTNYNEGKGVDACMNHCQSAVSAEIDRLTLRICNSETKTTIALPGHAEIDAGYTARQVCENTGACPTNANYNYKKENKTIRGWAYICKSNPGILCKKQ